MYRHQQIGTQLARETRVTPDRDDGAAVVDLRSALQVHERALRIVADDEIVQIEDLAVLPQRRACTRLQIRLTDDLTGVVDARRLSDHGAVEDRQRREGTALPQEPASLQRANDLFAIVDVTRRAAGDVQVPRLGILPYHYVPRGTTAGAQNLAMLVQRDS